MVQPDSILNTYDGQSNAGGCVAFEQLGDVHKNEQGQEERRK